MYLEKCFTDAGDDLKNGETIWKDVYLPSPFRGRHDTFKQAPKTSGLYTLELLESRDLLLHSWPKRRSFLHRLYSNYYTGCASDLHRRMCDHKTLSEMNIFDSDIGNARYNTLREFHAGEILIFRSHTTECNDLRILRDMESFISFMLEKLRVNDTNYLNESITGALSKDLKLTDTQKRQVGVYLFAILNNRRCTHEKGFLIGTLP